MANKIQIRRDTTAHWGVSDPILSQGELGLDTTLNKMKIGDGVSHWSELSFFIGNTGATGATGATGPQGPAGVTQLSNLTNSSVSLSLNATGSLTFPTLSVDIHNGGVQSAQVLKFDDATKQVIITGPTPAAGNSAERIIIQGQRATGNGEGGDVYLWGGDSDINGGDIKIYAGDADGASNGATGGYVNIDAGNGFTNGGNLTLSAGNANSSQAGSYGGNINITAGHAFNGTPGNIQLNTYAPDSANLAWTFTNDGVLTLPNSGEIFDYAGGVGTLGILISRTFHTPDDANSANFGTDTITLLLSDAEAAEIGDYLLAGIGVKVWFNQGDSYPITSRVQVSTGIWTITATGMGNRFATFAAINTLIFIYTGATPNTYTNFPQYELAGAGAAVVVFKGGKSWYFDKTGDLNLPPSGTIRDSMTGDSLLNPTKLINSAHELVLNVNGAGPWISFPESGGQQIQIQGTDINGIGLGDLALASYTRGVVISANASATDSPRRDWTFGTDSKLTLPEGGVIAESGGLTGAIKLTPAGGANAYQALVIYPTAALDGDHIHLTAGGGSTELYLGNDTHYVKLVNGGDVAVQASTADLSSTAAWTFDTVGNIDAQQALGIKVPDGVPSSVTAITMTTGSWETNPLSSLTTTGGSGTGLTVNVAETGGYATTIEIATAGTGYNNGDYITVTSGTSNATFNIAVAGRNTWLFGLDGRTTFPNGTVPAHSYGAAGDKEGMVVFSDNYIYYCKQDYAVNSVNVTTLASSGLYVYVSSTDYAGDLVADFTANSTGWTYAAVSIISVAVDDTFGPGYILEAATSFGAINGNDYALVSPVTPNIWKRVSWSVDTW